MPRGLALIFAAAVVQKRNRKERHGAKRRGRPQPAIRVLAERGRDGHEGQGQIPVRAIDANRTELTTQFTSDGVVYAQKVPDGGFYSRAIDIERLTSGTTKLTYYGASFDSAKQAWVAIKRWSDGNATPCP